MLDSGYNLIKHISSTFLSLAISLPFLPPRFAAAFRFVCTYTDGGKKKRTRGMDAYRMRLRQWKPWGVYKNILPHTRRKRRRKKGGLDGCCHGKKPLTAIWVFFFCVPELRLSTGVSCAELGDPLGILRLYFWTFRKGKSEHKPRQSLFRRCNLIPRRVLRSATLVAAAVTDWRIIISDDTILLANTCFKSQHGPISTCEQL